MTRWTFGRTITAGFVAVLALYLLAGTITLTCVRGLVASKDRVITVDMQLQIKAEQLMTARAERSAGTRAYLLSGNPEFRTDAVAATTRFEQLLDEARRQVHTDRGRLMVDKIAAASAEASVAQDQMLSLKERGATDVQVREAFSNAAPLRLALQASLTEFGNYERGLAEAGMRDSSRAAARDTWIILVTLLLGVLATSLMAALIIRRVRARIGSVVGDVQISSTQLQGTANQQAVGAMEQASAMSEISTTLTELLATSRQITESAQSVSDVAEQTATAGQAGRSTLASAQRSMTEIRQQVDVIVNHMLELGDKSQRIGVVLDIVSELAEQTNILAINSTIEAAGAGESGRRFGVVADEIRKLADRVAESTKEIRSLIDLIRGAVHTTVIATEIGSKAVDSGTAQVTGVVSAFQQIVDMVETTTEAAREIELSTKQQTTAVEQVNFAVANLTQTTKETEATSTQTLETASQLAELSTRLRKMIEPVTTG